MPVSIKVAEDELGVEPSVGRFLIPLGTTVNMARSAIWHTSAIVFLATVLVKVGGPVEGVSLIMGGGRILEMGCTVVNVTGDITASKLFSNS